VIGETVLRLHNVVPLGLVMLRLNPPWNQPQERPAVLSKSPIGNDSTMNLQPC
jgi:hypothetical protein